MNSQLRDISSGTTVESVAVVVHPSVADALGGDGTEVTVTSAQGRLTGALRVDDRLHRGRWRWPTAGGAERERPDQRRRGRRSAHRMVRQGGVPVELRRADGGSELSVAPDASCLTGTASSSDEGAGLRAAVAVPDLVELGLVVDDARADHEHLQQQAGDRRARVGGAGGVLGAGDALAGPVERHQPHDGDELGEQRIPGSTSIDWSYSRTSWFTL